MRAAILNLCACLILHIILPKENNLHNKEELFPFHDDAAYYVTRFSLSPPQLRSTRDAVWNADDYDILSC